MNHIFISYSRKDSEVVDGIVARLTQDGFKVWIDREDIKGGELWREAIVEAVDTAYACILMLSPDSVASNNVRKEVDLTEGAGKALVPVLLAPVKLPANLRYQLAGIQWVEYFRDPKVKYDELVQVLQSNQESNQVERAHKRELEIVIGKIKYSKFGPEEQETLLDFIADLTNTPRTEINIARITPGSVHAFIKIPANAAYQLKTAALNRNNRLINFGIVAIRLSGDHHFVLLKTGSIGSLKPRKPWFLNWFIGGILLTATILGLTLSKSPDAPVLPTAKPDSTTTLTETITSTVTPKLTGTSTATPFIITITVTTPPLSCTPTLIANKNTNCRYGPSTSYGRAATLLQEQTATILGVNELKTWYKVVNPLDEDDSCWVWRDLVQVQGDLECIPVEPVDNVPPPDDTTGEKKLPPPPPPPSCEPPPSCPEGQVWWPYSCSCIYFG